MSFIGVGIPHGKPGYPCLGKFAVGKLGTLALVSLQWESWVPLPW